jgi:hypothetical protein
MQRKDDVWRARDLASRPGRPLVELTKRVEVWPASVGFASRGVGDRVAELHG